MTYITYTKKQYSYYKEIRVKTLVRLDKNRKIKKMSELESIQRYSQPPKKIPSILPKSNFMPSYLVRACDMKVVKGSEVQEGYCIISYSWNQSGEILLDETTGKSYRIDQGKHKIIFPGKTVRKKPRGRKRIPGKVKFVKFEGLIQEICKDFNVKYIWYDQMCVNQNDEKEKCNEIYQMHQIYSNAYCTIALVPDLTATVLKPTRHNLLGYAVMDHSTLPETKWMKRMWTLVEAILSSKIILIGKNIHYWYHEMSNIDFPMLRNDLVWDIAHILHYAHARTSTKEHDHVFALANIFPGIMKKITVDYNQDIQELMIQFYGFLAKMDLSILFFGKYYYYKTMCQAPISCNTEGKSTSEAGYNIPVQKFDLPSWTGVYGEHNRNRVYKTSFKNYTVKGRILQITCAALTNDQHNIVKLDLESIKIMLPPFPEEDNSRCWTLVLRLQPQGSTNEKFILIESMTSRKLDSTDYKHIATALNNLSHFMAIKKINLLWTTTLCPRWTMLDFHGLTEPLENSAQYMLLAGVRFRENGCEGYTHYPVIKKEGNYYKSIGMCYIDLDKHFFNDFALEEQTFKIH